MNELETKEQACKNAFDFCELASSVKDDLEYTKSLLNKAELQC